MRGGAGASFLNKTLREGVTEGTQSVVEQTGSTAGTQAGLDAGGRQAIGEGIIGGTTAGGFDAAGKTSKAQPDYSQGTMSLQIQLAQPSSGLERHCRS